MSDILKRMYDAAFVRFGDLDWWPGESPFEIAVGAILTQNTAWTNVEKAIVNLKNAGALSADSMAKLKHEELAELIRPSGYYNIKAKRLCAFLDFLFERYGGSLDEMAKADTLRLRKELLSINGVGPETADCILLYALGHEVFVVDSYTKRIFSRHAILNETDDYETVRAVFESAPGCSGRELFVDFHAQIVNIGKKFCLKKKPDCENCPWRSFLPDSKISLLECRQ